MYTALQPGEKRMNFKEKFAAQPISLTNRHLVPVVERTAWLTPQGGWYMTRVCSLRIEENGTVYTYQLLPASPTQNDHEIKGVKNEDSKKT
jgi:hypothetical protein